MHYRIPPTSESDEMKLNASDGAIELVPETPFEREQLKRLSAYAEVRLEVTTNSGADSSSWPYLGPTGTLRILLPRQT